MTLAMLAFFLATYYGRYSKPSRDIYRTFNSSMVIVQAAAMLIIDNSLSIIFLKKLLQCKDELTTTMRIGIKVEHENTNHISKVSNLERGDGEDKDLQLESSPQNAMVFSKLKHILLLMCAGPWVFLILFFVGSALVKGYQLAYIIDEIAMWGLPLEVAVGLRYVELICIVMRPSTYPSKWSNSVMRSNITNQTESSRSNNAMLDRLSPPLSPL